MRIAVVAVSSPGCMLAIRLGAGMADAEVFLPERLAPGVGDGVHRWRSPLGDAVRRLFAEYDGLVVFGAVGMVVRLIGPAITNKHTDPAVVVVDDAGRFAVSVLSGHLGGANALTEHVAGIIGAQPVITTASDVLGTLAADLLGQKLGWRIEHPESIARVSAAIVNGEAVGIVQEAGELDWWSEDKPLPANIARFASLDELTRARCTAALIISDRMLDGCFVPAVVYRPRSLVVGIGCNRGTSAGEIAEAVNAALAGHGLSPASVRNLATVDVKRDEAGIRECAGRMGVDVAYFAAGELDGVEGVASRSATVRKWLGTSGVCEPAALLSAGTGTLVVPKVKTPNVTVAVARIDFSRAREE